MKRRVIVLIIAAVLVLALLIWLLWANSSPAATQVTVASDALPELTVLPYDLRRADERRQELFDAWQALCGEVEA